MGGLGGMYVECVCGCGGEKRESERERERASERGREYIFVYKRDLLTYKRDLEREYIFVHV
jgi:hypothetical protein